MRLFKKRRFAGAIAATCFAAAVVAAPAAAEFTTPYDVQCSGDATAGAGASSGDRLWQTNATEFTSAPVAEACPSFEAGDVTYKATTSGDGLAAFLGSRDPEVRFVGSAEAPGPVEQALLEVGNPFTSQDDAELRTIPQFAASIAVIVNFPEGCTIPAESAIGSGTAQRFQVSNATLEAAFAGDATVDTWGELLPGIGGEGCAEKPVHRVVRDDRSGATFALKRWLHSVNGERGWKLLSNALLNTVWPKQSVNLIRAADASPSGSVDEATTVAATDGSIGYVSLDTARLQGFSEQGASNDDNYWIPVRNASGALAEPSQNTVTSLIRGANCTTVTFAGVPAGEDPTLENWREVSAAGTEAGYPLCTLVHALAWDDASDAYGGSEAEQARQRTVRDFLGYQLSLRGQNAASGGDQSRLSPGILAVAQGGQQAMGWDKP